jgi:Serine dehydrogenase proteinase
VEAIRAIEQSHATRVITMIHRQEKRSLFGFPGTSISRMPRR